MPITNIPWWSFYFPSDTRSSLSHYQFSSILILKKRVFILENWSFPTLYMKYRQTQTHPFVQKVWALKVSKNGSDIHEPKYYFKPPNSHWLLSSEIIYFSKQINKPCQKTQQYFACLFLPFPLTAYSSSYGSCAKWGHLTGMDIVATLSALVGQN